MSATFGGPLCEEDPETTGYCAYHRTFTCDAEEGPSCTCERTPELSLHEPDCPVPSGGRPERGASNVEAVCGMIFMLALLATILVLTKGWPGQTDGASLEEQRKTRHAICEVLAVTGADATNAADVAACTFEGEGS